MIPQSTPRAIARLLLLAPALTVAATPGEECTGIVSDTQRLACYDRVHGRQSAGTPGQPPEAAPVAESTPAPESTSAPSSKSSLSALWDLDAGDKRGTFQLRPHHATYLLPLRWTNRANLTPSSPAAGHQVASPLPVEALESKFQVSAKVKIFENLLGDTGDLWFAYTQQSNWQLYNSEQSSPFRETNYEPEVIFTLRTEATILGWRWRLLNLGFAHQSNGRSLPLSRSWNRVYAQFGLERGSFKLFARPWIRIPERDSSDDNPDIRKYMGSSDLGLVYARGGHVLSAVARYSFSGGRGALQLDWAYPISGALKGYLQITRGYGESLIDYNHSQTTIGLGILLLPWQ